MLPIDLVHRLRRLLELEDLALLRRDQEGMRTLCRP